VAVFEAVEGEIKRDDPDDPHRTFLRQVLGAAAQLERGLVPARLQGGRRRKAARGGWVGDHRLHRRYGYRVAVDDEQRAIDRMAALRADGKTYREIATAMAAEDWPLSPSGTWHATTVRKVLVREQRA
jgi:DNA invertase Pin-like site-specific DNA recombinase